MTKRIEAVEKGLLKLNSPPTAYVIEFNNPSEIEELRRRKGEDLIEKYGTAEKTMILCCQKMIKKPKVR